MVPLDRIFRPLVVGLWILAGLLIIGFVVLRIIEAVQRP